MAAVAPEPTVPTVRRPVALRVLNGVGGALRRVGLPVVRLDEDALVARAMRQTGLDDFGDGAFREPLRRLLDAFEREARLTLLGRVIARTDVVRLLANRLRMTDVRRRHPEIDAGEVRRPIVIVGLPRTGTTILHELMAQDPANRVPMTWEVMHPWPPPERATYDTDPRIAEVERHFTGVERLIPGFQSMHPMGARLPQECVALTAHDFATMLFSTTHDVPGYQAWLAPTGWPARRRSATVVCRRPRASSTSTFGTSCATKSAPCAASTSISASTSRPTPRRACAATSPPTRRTATAATATRSPRRG